MWPAELALTSFKFTFKPLGTTTLLPTTMGESSEPRKRSPVRLVCESMESMVRTLTMVRAGMVTVMGCGGGGGGGGFGISGLAATAGGPTSLGVGAFGLEGSGGAGASWADR